MATIKRNSNGNILTREGKASCSCCEIEIYDINIGEPQECPCAGEPCFSPDNPAPDGHPYFWRLGPAAIQLQWNLVVGWDGIQTGYYSRFRNITEPTPILYYGLVAGDVYYRRISTDQYPTNDEIIPQEGLYPCPGQSCSPPRNNSEHPFEFVATYYPNTNILIYIQSYMYCIPWLRMKAIPLSNTPP